MTRSSFRRSVALIAVLAAAFPAADAHAQADAAMPNPPEFPNENPLLPGQDTLGKFLFWEEQLSQDNTMSCGTCHIHEAGGSDPRLAINPGLDGLFNTSDDVHGSAGVVRMSESNNFLHSALFGSDVQVTGRKSPPAINALYFDSIFWDGRAGGNFVDPQTGLIEIAYVGALESQAAGPPVSDVEMSPVGETWNSVVAKLVTATPLALGTNLPSEMADFLADHPTYPDMFEAVYGDPAITSKRILFAIANYERTLISDGTVLDEFLKGNIPQMPPEFLPGFTLFQGAANCATCHVMPFTANDNFHNIGVRPDAEDVGRFAVTADPADMGRFKTPNIRNSKLRTPLFHNGGKNSVLEVVEFYNQGGDFPGPNLDINLVPLNLTAQQITDVVTLIEGGMTDPRVENNVFPFTRPTLRSELTPLNTQYGVASLSGLGETPRMLGHQTAFPGNNNFTLGLADAKPSAPAILLLAFLPDPAGTPFPDPRYPVPVNLNLGTLILDSLTSTDADGVTSFTLPVPPNALYSGMKFYAQWFIGDAAALATGGVYGTKGLEVEIL